MSISLTEDIKTFSELEQSPRKVLNQVHRTGRPVVLTVKGKPDVVLMNVETFEKRLKIANLSQLLLEAEADVVAGRTRPASQFLKDIEGGTKKTRG